MRNVSYVVLGGVNGELPEQGTIADLLLTVPYLKLSQFMMDHRDKTNRHGKGGPPA